MPRLYGEWPIGAIALEGSSLTRRSSRIQACSGPGIVPCSKTPESRRDRSTFPIRALAWSTRKVLCCSGRGSTEFLNLPGVDHSRAAPFAIIANPPRRCGVDGRVLRLVRSATRADTHHCFTAYRHGDSDSISRGCACAGPYEPPYVLSEHRGALLLPGADEC